MSELIGQTLIGRYRVDAFVGRGGMAEVYKVWDTRRATHLAMKLLREDLAQDIIFLRRFKREAEHLSMLQHPNIVRFYGLERDGLFAFMLMDYVDGASLRSEIFKANGAPFALERVREIMRPVCSALYYAHNQNVVHCDVKPGNILIDHNGQILMSDFGIARMSEGATTATMVGAGTPAYMAPEQIRGENPTPQTDIYALGIVLYEMLTGGERPFTGDHAKITGTASEKVHWEQIHLQPPSPRMINKTLTRSIDRVILTSLNKEPTGRQVHMLNFLSDLEFALDDRKAAALSHTVSTPGNAASAKEPLTNSISSPVESQAKQPVPPSTRPAPLVSAQFWRTTLAITAGAAVVIAGGLGLTGILGGNRETPGEPTLAELAHGNPTQAAAPVILPTDMPAPSPVPTATAQGGGTGRIAFVSGSSGKQSVYIMDTDGSNRKNLTPECGFNDHPAWSPDGTKIAFDAFCAASSELGIYVMDADGNNLTQLANGEQPAWSPDGTRIAFVRGSYIYLMQNDGSNQVGLVAGYGPSWSPDGLKIAFSEAFQFVLDGRTIYHVAEVPVDGSDTPTDITGFGVDGNGPAWSPDGERIAFVSGCKGTQIAVMDTKGGNRKPLIDCQASSRDPSWSPDGTHLAFSSNRDGNWEIYVMDADGSGLIRLTHNPADDAEPAWQPL